MIDENCYFVLFDTRTLSVMHTGRCALSDVAQQCISTDRDGHPSVAQHLECRVLKEVTFHPEDLYISTDDYQVRWVWNDEIATVPREFYQAEQL